MIITDWLFRWKLRKIVTEWLGAMYDENDEFPLNPDYRNNKDVDDLVDKLAAYLKEVQ